MNIYIKHIFSNNGGNWLVYYALCVLDKFVHVNDRLFLKYEYSCMTERRLNLKTPRTYTEKLAWIKLYDRNPLYTTMVDKFSAKDYVAGIIGSQYIIPTLGVWDKPEDIEWDNLPGQFVLKCTHDSSGLVICKDKSKLDKAVAKQKLTKCLKRDFYRISREWPYKNVPHRIIAEQYMEDEKTQELRDYKFFCMDGIPRALFIATERQHRKEPYFDFFDMDFNNMHIVNVHPNAPEPPEKPVCFEEMKTVAAQLSKGIPEVRVDLYEVNGKVYFGELTLFHMGGISLFHPDEWNEIFGDWITLPGKRD